MAYAADRRPGAVIQAGLEKGHQAALAHMRANLPGGTFKADGDGDEPKMTPVSKGHKPSGAHGRAAVKAIGRTKTTGNFAKIEAAKGKGAAIAAYQAKLKAHKAGK